MSAPSGSSVFLLRRQKNLLDLSGLNKCTVLLSLACLCLLTQAGLTRAQPLSDLPLDKLTKPDDITKGFEQGQNTVKVIVNLAEPSEIIAVMDWRSRPALNALHAEVLTRQQKVLNTLAAGEFKLRRRFENLTAFSAEVTRDGLAKLINNPMVESIEPVHLLQLHLAQGVPLINGSVYRSTYNGQGVAVAICDTGIDYTHSKLGGGGFPNSKVIGGYDFGDDDSNPTPGSEAHGTCCAGIAAGDLGTVGDYIGGVACNSKIYALKVEDSGGSIYEDYIISAWDWCVSHKDDDPCHPILFISNSFGGGRYTSADSAESTELSLNNAVNRAVAAGITVLASSGNEGYCDSMAAPAAFSSVISVGAVYDAAIGYVGFCIDPASCGGQSYPSCSSSWACFNNSAADMVTCYSNTASFLNLLAPSNNTYTTDIVGSGGYNSGDYHSQFGGTSAACPYAAGAAACLQSAAKDIRGGYLTPTEVKSVLTSTGDNITDGKIAITKPRVNLGNAIDSLYTPSGYVAIRGSWATGTTHMKESGDNRALVFIAHARGSSISLTDVTYGGRPMTKITDKAAGVSSIWAYVAAFVLDDANIVNADANGDFGFTWTSTPSYAAYSSVFLQDVNQTALIGESASASTTNGTSLSTSAISTNNGDMVIDAAACNTAGDYSVNNGFTEATDISPTFSRYLDGVDGYKSATGPDETPSVTHSTSGYHALIGFVVQALEAAPFPTRTLTVASSAGGTVTQPGIGDFNYPDGNIVDLNAVPDAGYHFVNWSGDTNTIADVNAAVTTITMDANYAIQAYFALTPVAPYITSTPVTTAVIDQIYTYDVDANGIPEPNYSLITSPAGMTIDPPGGLIQWTPDAEQIGDVNVTVEANNIAGSDTQSFTITVSDGIILISGYVIEIDGNTPVEGVLIQTDDNDINSVTDANGFYELRVDYNWSGIVIPQKDGYVFEPNSNTYVDVTLDHNDVNYTATLTTFKITGYVLEPDYVTPINDVNVSAENGGGQWTSRYGGGTSLTDVNGYYEVLVDYLWSGNVTPAKRAYVFEPNSRYYEDVNEDYTAGQDYNGTLLTFRIAGYIKNECNAPVGSVLVDADNNGRDAITDINGFYEVWVDYSWSGTVAPAKRHYTFDPNSISYVDVLADQLDQNYAAANFCDLNCDGYIDWIDFAIIADNWLATGPEIPGDFDTDEDVDFSDFAEFGLSW